MSRAVSSVSGGGELALLSALKLLTEAQSVAMYATVENEKRLFSAAADPKVFSMSLCENGMIDLRQCTNHHNLVWDWAESVDVNQHKVRYTGKAKDWCKLDVSNALGQRLGRLELVREIDRNELNLEQRIYQDLKNAPPGHVYHLVFLGDDPRESPRNSPRGSFSGSPRGSFSGSPRGSFSGSSIRRSFRDSFNRTLSEGPLMAQKSWRQVSNLFRTLSVRRKQNHGMEDGAASSIEQPSRTRNQ